MALYTAALHCTSVIKTAMLISQEFGKGHPDFGHSSSGHLGPQTFRSSRRPGLLDVQFSELCNFQFSELYNFQFSELRNFQFSELCNLHFQTSSFLNSAAYISDLLNLHFWILKLTFLNSSNYISELFNLHFWASQPSVSISCLRETLKGVLTENLFHYITLKVIPM